MKINAYLIAILLEILQIYGANACNYGVIACIDHNGSIKGQLFNDQTIAFRNNNISCLPYDYTGDQLSAMCNQQISGCKHCTAAWKQQ